MEALTMGLAIAATILSITAILLEVFFYRTQTEQAHAIAKDNAEFTERMAGFLGELKGLTTTTRDQLQTQFDRMLEATLQRQAPAVETAVMSRLDSKVDEIIKTLTETRLTEISAPATESGTAQAEQVVSLIESLRGELPAAIVSALRQATEVQLEEEPQKQTRLATQPTRPSRHLTALSWAEVQILLQIRSGIAQLTFWPVSSSSGMRSWLGGLYGRTGAGLMRLGLIDFEPLPVGVGFRPMLTDYGHEMLRNYRSFS